VSSGATADMCMPRSLRLSFLLGTAAILPPVHGQNSSGMAHGSWVYGHVCADVNYSSAMARDMLRNKHLRVLESGEARPLKYRDQAGQWRGVDVDLLNQLSYMLGFSYEIHDFGRPPTGTSWTSWVLRMCTAGDLVGGQWSPNVARRDGAIQIKGHLDASLVLVTRPEEAADRDTTFANAAHALFSWSLPFSPWVWVAIIALVLSSGVVDWIVERDHVPGHRVSSSLCACSAHSTHIASAHEREARGRRSVRAPPTAHAQHIASLV
jgi:hypothetical protein